MINDEVRRKIDILSPTEREVLELVCEGLKYKEIKDRLHMSVSAIKTHMTAVRLKFGIDQLSQWETTIEINNTYCSALKEIREQSVKEKSDVIAPEVETKTEPKTESKPELKPEPQDKEKENVPDKEPEIEKDEDEDRDKGKETEKPKADVINKVDKKDEEKSDTSKPKPPIDEKVYEKKEGYQMKKTDQPKHDRFRSLKIIWRIILIIAIIFSGYVIYDRFFSSLPTQPAVSTEESSTVSTADVETLPTEETPIAVIPTETKILPTEIPTIEPASPPKPAILFEDDFDSGLSDAWEVVYGNPIVINSTLSADQDTWLLVGDPAWTDYSVEFQGETEKNFFWADADIVGLRIADLDNMYAYKWTTVETEWHIVENGEWNVVPKSYVNDQRNIKHFLFEVKGDSVKLLIDGVNESSFFDDKFTHGRIGLFISKDTVIDGFKVREVLD